MTATTDDRETALARQAGQAIGRRPLSAEEKSVLFACWRRIHGHQFDCEKNLAAHEREAAGRKEAERERWRAAEAKAVAEKLRDARRAAAVRGVAEKLAEALRLHLPATLRDRFQVFGGRDAVKVIAPGESDDATPAHAGQVVVLVRAGSFERSYPDGRPQARITVEVRARDKDTAAAVLNQGGDGISPINEAAGRGRVPSGWQRAAVASEDRRQFGRAVEADGSMSWRVKGGFVGRTDSFTVNLAADPDAAGN
jgi:hypothetical protein